MSPLRLTKCMKIPAKENFSLADLGQQFRFGRQLEAAPELTIMSLAIVENLSRLWAEPRPHLRLRFTQQGFARTKPVLTNRERAATRTLKVHVSSRGLPLFFNPFKKE